MTADRVLLARRVTLLRGLQGWDQTTLATQADVSPEYIQAIEAGEAVPLDSLEALSDALGVPTSDLIEPAPLGIMRALLSRDGSKP